MWAASAEYRLTAPGAGVKIADIVLDAKDAVRYVRSHAEELGIDPDRIAAAGGSAGGHLAAATAVVPEENPPGTVSGKANLLVLFNPALFYPSAGKTLTLEQFTKDTPPAILFYGTKDDMLQYGMDCLAQSRRLGFPLRPLYGQGRGPQLLQRPALAGSHALGGRPVPGPARLPPGPSDRGAAPRQRQLDEIKEPPDPNPEKKTGVEEKSAKG